MRFECTTCDIDFESKLKPDGFLPDCPKCGIDYRVFEVEEPES